MDKFEEAWKENRHVWESSKNLAKAMYLAGQQSRQAEVDEANAKSQMCRDEKTHAINRWSQIRKEVEEKDKRITELEKSEFALAKVKQILNKHIKTRLLESIIVRELIDLLFSNKG